MITQIHTSIDPETCMWNILNVVHKDNEKSLRIHLTNSNNQTLRTYVGDKMGFQPRFTRYGTQYANRMQTDYKRLIDMMTIKYYDAFREKHQFCKQIEEPPKSLINIIVENFAIFVKNLNRNKT